MGRWPGWGPTLSSELDQAYQALPTHALLAGILALVLAAVWRYGVELQRDRDLTV